MRRLGRKTKTAHYFAGKFFNVAVKREQNTSDHRLAHLTFKDSNYNGALESVKCTFMHLLRGKSRPAHDAKRVLSLLGVHNWSLWGN